MITRCRWLMRGCKNTGSDVTADKYAQTSVKAERTKIANQVPDNDMCIKQNKPLFSFIPIYGLKDWVHNTCTSAECTDILQLHKI